MRWGIRVQPDSCDSNDAGAAVASATNVCSTLSPLARTVNDGASESSITDPPAAHRSSDPLFVHLGGEPQVEMPALAGSFVVVGALEPQAGDPSRGIEDRVVDPTVRTAREQDPYGVYWIVGMIPLAAPNLMRRWTLAHRRVPNEGRRLVRSAELPSGCGLILLRDRARLVTKG